MKNSCFIWQQTLWILLIDKCWPLEAQNLMTFSSSFLRLSDSGIEGKENFETNKVKQKYDVK